VRARCNLGAGPRCRCNLGCGAAGPDTTLVRSRRAEPPVVWMQPWCGAGGCNLGAEPVVRSRWCGAAGAGPRVRSRCAGRRVRGGGCGAAGAGRRVRGRGCGAAGGAEPFVRGRLGPWVGVRAVGTGRGWVILRGPAWWMRMSRRRAAGRGGTRCALVILVLARVHGMCVRARPLGCHRGGAPGILRSGTATGGHRLVVRRGRQWLPGGRRRR
jgi:hypothetical protein